MRQNQLCRLFGTMLLIYVMLMFSACAVENTDDSKDENIAGHATLYEGIFVVSEVFYDSLSIADNGSYTLASVDDEQPDCSGTWTLSNGEYTFTGNNPSGTFTAVIDNDGAIILTRGTISADGRGQNKAVQDSVNAQTFAGKTYETVSVYIYDEINTDEDEACDLAMACHYTLEKAEMFVSWIDDDDSEFNEFAEAGYILFKYNFSEKDETEDLIGYTLDSVDFNGKELTPEQFKKTLSIFDSSDDGLDFDSITDYGYFNTVLQFTDASNARLIINIEGDEFDQDTQGTFTVDTAARLVSVIMGEGDDNRWDAFYTNGGKRIISYSDEVDGEDGSRFCFMSKFDLKQ